MERRLFRATAWAVVGACALFAAYLAVVRSQHQVLLATGSLAMATAPLFAAGACFWAARRATTARKGWLLLGLAAMSWGLGQVVWSWQVMIGTDPLPFPTIADVGRLATLPLAAAGVLALAEQDSGVRIRTALDCAVVAVSLFMLGWVVLLAPLYEQGLAGPLERAIALAYPVGDVVIAAILVLSVSRARPSGRLALGLVGAGLAAQVLADGVFAYGILSGAFPGYLPIGGWFIGFGLLGLAALAPAGPDAAGWTPREKGSVVLPSYLLLLLAGSSYVVAVLRGWVPDVTAALCAFTVLLLITARLLLAVRENRVLLQELRDREEHFRSLVQHSSDLITLVGSDGMVRYQSPSVTRVLGYAPDELVGAPVSAFLHPDDAESTLAALRDQDVCATGKPIEARVRHARGGWRHVESTLTHGDGGALSGLVITTRDVSERKELERQLSHQAFHDGLTGLANRALFVNRAEHALASHQRDRGGVGILYVDLDNFKRVNDALGHSAGDELLTAVADRLSALSRPGDTVARLGGDEFALLIPGVRQTELTPVAGRIAEAFAKPFTVLGREVSVGASIGLASADGAVANATDLLRNADLAMYQAKRRGKGRWEPFEHAMRAEAVSRQELEEELRTALDADEFVVHYQPIVTLGDGRVTGVEALLRWQHRVHGLLTPVSFLSVAEDADLLPALGGRVLETACKQVEAWRAEMPGCLGLVAHVNLSARQLADPALPTAVADTLAASSLPADGLVLEVPEGALSEGVTGMAARLGVRLAINDFGAGGSSLAQLKRHRVDMIKVDRFFMSELGQDAEAAGFVRAILELGRTLGVDAVATGVQREIDARILGELGYELGQGFSLAPPQPAAEVERLLRKGPALVAIMP